jgi:hypothetical protein
MLERYGALTTLWTPPASCLSTTTYWGASFFIGYQSDAGGGLQCYPSIVPTPTKSDGLHVPVTTSPLIATGTTTGSDTLYVTITGYTTIYSDISSPPTPQTSLYPYATFYYSPGICPSGYTYAITCMKPPQNTGTELCR